MNKTRKDLIAEVLANHKHGLHVDDIANELLSKGLEKNYPLEELSQKVSLALSQDIRKYKNKSRFSIVKNKKGGHKRGWYRLKIKHKTDEERVIGAIEKGTENENKNLRNTNYIGIAGEYAVLSELLFNEFNAAVMTVDVGVDVVAFKNGKYFYIQVKTSKKHGSFYTTISTKQFEKYNEAGTYYIFVLRYTSNGKEINGFIIMNSATLQIYRDKKVIKKSNSLNISISIKGGKIILNNKEDISVYLDRFDYIK